MNQKMYSYLVDDDEQNNKQKTKIIYIYIYKLLKDAYLDNFINIYLFSPTSPNPFHYTKYVLNAGIIS